MKSANAITVIVILFGAALIAVLVAVIGREGISKATFDKGQRFTAKPGTTRENAIILTSSKRAETQAPKDAIARRAEEREDTDPLEVKSLSGSKPDAHRQGPAGDTAREALNSPSPAMGLRKLEAALSLPQEPAKAALLHEAKGQLYARLDPPALDESRASFAEAAELAGTPKHREEIVAKSVQMLMLADRDEEARETLEAHLAAHPPEQDGGYKLLLLRGQLAERAGQVEAAEKNYQSVLAAAREVPDSLDRESALTLTRLAGMRLTSLYRKNDRDQAADVLSEELKKLLARMEAE